VIWIKDVPARIPPKDDKLINLTTVYRWNGKGLRTVLIGGARATTQRWLLDYFEMQTAARDRNDEPAPSVSKTRRKSRRRRLERVDRELDELGIGI
jgi:hypothetical protein